MLLQERDPGFDVFPVLLECSLFLAVMIASGGVGSLMAAIGKIRGWNTKSTFWISAFLYGLLIVGVDIVDVFADAFLNITIPNYRTISLALITIGIVFSPVAKLVLTWRYPDAFKKSIISQMVVEKEPSLPRQPLMSRNHAQSEPAAPPVMNTNAVTRSGRILISYRRSDSSDIAGRIYDRLIGKFGKEPIFKDVDSIPLGLDFKEYLEQMVSQCDVLLAIIGDRWLDASDSTGRLRLEDPEDFVRIEIQSALERGIPVIPLLVRGTQMPREENLPASLRKLAYRNGIPIRSDPDFHRDMDRLISALEKHIGQE